MFFQARRAGRATSTQGNARLLAVGVSGAGQRPLPGEMSLAHHGILSMDERPTCTRQVL
jgi:predicted ATPase with chaperone activity